MSTAFEKVRIWIKKDSIFKYVSIKELILKDSLPELRGLSEDDIVVQPALGLKDCKSNEIYVGDIIRYRDYKDFRDKQGYLTNYEVKLETYALLRQYSAGVFHIPEEGEVIGNVLENPRSKK